METVAGMQCMNSADMAGLTPGQSTECLNDDLEPLCMGGTSTVVLLPDGSFEINFVDCKTVDPYCNQKDSFYVNGIVKLFPGANSIYIKNINTNFMGIIEGNQIGAFTVGFGEKVTIEGNFDDVNFAYKVNENDIINEMCNAF